MSHTTTATVLAPVDTDRAFRIVQRQLERLITTHPDRIPVYTENGRWHIDGAQWAPEWTSGFLAGMIWAIADRTGDAQWRARAEHYCLLFEGRKLDTGTHDLGFLFTPSWERWYDHEPTQQIADVIVTAARSLATNYNEQGRYLRTWVDEGSSFIDIMMNLGLLYRGAELSGDPSLAGVATNHALTSRRYLVRGDSSTVHEGWFDPNTGQFLRSATHQGWRDDSCWVRGQAWATYGFTVCYAKTGDERFLSTATECADLYIERTGDALIAPNDWDDPHPEFRYEASGATPTAAALLQLAELGVPGADKYAKYGSRMLERLASEEFLATEDDEWEGLIKHATYHRTNGLGVEQSNMWGDYYFVEALERYDRLRTAESAR